MGTLRQPESRGRMTPQGSLLELHEEDLVIVPQNYS